jgi:Dolichyl-phosphate-mannose-protein mannosyltransferase
MNLVFFLIGVNLVKLLLIPYFPLIGDEAYYWLWGQRLDWAYLEHPPLIAYVNHLLTAMFGPSELAIRGCAIGLVFLISVIIYLTGKELFGEKAGATAAVIFNLLPTFLGGGLFLVPQLLLFFFFSLSFYLLARLIKRHDAMIWYWLGLAIGLGLLSDFGMLLFPLAVLIFLLINREERGWLGKKEPYLAALIALLFIVPLLIWEVNHGFPTLRYHGNRATTNALYNFAYSALLQIVLYTPPVFFAAYGNAAGLIAGRRRDLPAVIGGAVFIPYTLLSFFIALGGHWTATAYLPVLLQMHRWKKRWLAATIFFALLVSLPAIGYFLFYPVPKAMAGHEYRINRQLSEYLARVTPLSGRTRVYSNNIGVAGLVSFHGRVPAYMAQGQHPQFDLWGRPELKLGDNVIYFNYDDTTLYARLKPLFASVIVEPEKRLFTKDSDIPLKTTIYICQSFKGGRLP